MPDLKSPRTPMPERDPVIRGVLAMPVPIPRAVLSRIVAEAFRRLAYADGYLQIPDRPGIGVEIDETACLAHPYQPHTLRHYTGALTDIRPAKSEFYF